MTKDKLWAAALLFPLVVGPIWCLAWHSHGGRLGTLSGLVLLGALVTSAITDFNRHRIYNWTTYSAFLWALIINVVASTTSLRQRVARCRPSRRPASSAPNARRRGDWRVPGRRGVCFLITLFGYDLSGGGAGDVKIAAVIGALLGLHDGIFAVAYSYMVAAIAIIAWSTWT